MIDKISFYTEKYFFYLCTPIIFILLYIIASDNPSEHILYNIPAMSLGYEFGFIKRGLLPEILDIFDIRPKKILKPITYISVIAFIATLIYQFRDYLAKENSFWILMVLFFCPTFLKNYVFDVGRLDILFFMWLLPVAFASFRTSAIMFLTFPISLLIHDAMAVFFFPAMFLIFTMRALKQNIAPKMIWSLASIHVISFTVISLILLRHGMPDASSDAILKYVIDKTNMDSALAIQHLLMPFSDHLTMSNSMAVWKKQLSKIHIWGLFIILSLPLILSFVRVMNKEISGYSMKNWMIYGFLFSGALIAMIMAVDRTRFFCDIIGICVVLGVALSKDDFFAHLEKIITSLPDKIRWLYYLTIFSVPYMGVVQPKI